MLHCYIIRLKTMKQLLFQFAMEIIIMWQ